MIFQNPFRYFDHPSAVIKTENNIGANRELSKGLGVTITRKTVELHEATISVDSKVGVGTRFTIRIPEYLQN